MANQSTDTSLFALIGAFSSGLDVFKKLKKRRRKQDQQQPEDEELRLRRSLQKGPLDMQSEYNRNYAVQGDKYREGDSAILAALAAILVKLNNGLVSFITTFLYSGKKDKKLDYRSMTSLSEASRFEAIRALSQLSLRLSRSNLDLLRVSESKSRTQRKKPERAKRNPKPVPSSGTTAGMIKTASASTPQLAMMRPRPKRSSSGSTTRLQGAQSPKIHLPESPPPPPYKKFSNKSTPNISIPQQHAPPAVPVLPQSHHYPPPPHRMDFVEEVRRRRVDKNTPSMYTFASDSTKLGEIPMRNWTRPFDFEEMQRKNMAAAADQSQHNIRQVETQKKKRGFFGLFRRGNNAAVSCGA